MTTATRTQWTSRIAFILAATGAAVGLGNIWKFPYMVGANGGAAFVLVYLVCVLLVGIPMLLSEVLIGRRGQKNIVCSLQNLASEAKSTQKWTYLAWLGIFSLILILSFYSVAASWALPYIVHAFSGNFNGLSTNEAQQLWVNMVSDPISSLFWMTLFLVLTLYIVHRGVKKGIEFASYIMVPALFGILLLLLFYAIKSGGFYEAIQFLFSFRWQDLTTGIIIDGIGQAAFSLAVGAGVLVAYGAYLSKKTNLVSTIFIIAGLDVLIALLAGLVIFPFVFANSASPEGGVGLIFQVLPLAFGDMQYGSIIGGLFFIFIFFAAWTSSISMAEPAVDTLCERYGLTRAKAILLIGSICWLIASSCVLSFNVWSEFTTFGERNIFESIADLASNILLPVGGLLFTIFAGWYMNIKMTRRELMGGRGIYLTWLYLTRYVAPIAIILILGASFIGQF